MELVDKNTIFFGLLFCLKCYLQCLSFFHLVYGLPCHIKGSSFSSLTWENLFTPASVGILKFGVDVFDHRN